MNRPSLFGALVSYIAVGLSTLAICPDLKAQPDALYGLKLAYPLKLPTLTDTDTIFRCAEDEFMHLQLQIDSKGAVTKIACNDITTGARVGEYNLFFKRLRFKLGTRDGKTVAQTIPAEIYLFADHRAPVVTFPVSPDGRVESSRLYWQAVEINGVTLPHLLKFPSFHSTLFGVDTTMSPPYALLKVDLGPDGAPTNIALAHTSYPNFAGQLINAANWGSYVPAKRGNQAIPSSCFLLVTFFPTISYPTRTLVIDWPDTSSTISHEKLAVRLLPDTLDYLSGPVPRLAENWTYAVAPTPGAWKSAGVFRFKIEKDGAAYLISGGNGSVAARRIGDALAQAMRFYPAINKWGHPVGYEGVIKVLPEGKSNVRVKFLWLQ